MTPASTRPRLYTLAVSAIIIMAIAFAGYFFIVKQFDEETSKAARVSTEVANDDMVEIIVNTLSSDIERVRAVLGHTDIKTTMRYAHLEQVSVTQKARDVINRLNSL